MKLKVKFLLIQQFVSWWAVVAVFFGAIFLPAAAVTSAGAISIAPYSKLHTGCSWVKQSLQNHTDPVVLANEVLKKMTLHEKATMVVLVMRPSLENLSDGVPRLCIPELWISDGPVGLGDGLKQVTEFPAPIGIAASFNPAIARSVGVALAQEAISKGINGVQGTELNLVRVPQGGRVFETYGEDPFLAGLLGTANIQGTQSQGVMAMVKHLGAYTQETARLNLNQIVTRRALEELYLAPFRTAVQQGHVASVMCSYGSINGVNSCSDPFLYSSLRSWGFSGFVRSDFHAVVPTAVNKAFAAGVSLIKPSRVLAIEHMVATGALPRRDLNRAVVAVLTQIFKFHEVGKPRTGSLYAKATTPSHVATALQAALSSTVLLKNKNAVLPLPATVKSIAVIGTDASRLPIAAGGGSSAVLAPYVVTPLAALRSTLGPKVAVTYSAGGPVSLDFDSLRGVAIVHGTPLKLITPYKSPGRLGKSDLIIDSSPYVTAAVATASHPGKGEGWSSWKMQVRARSTGTYEVSVQQCGDAWFYLDHRPILSSAGIQPCSDVATTVHLVKNHLYLFDAHWFSVTGIAPPKFGILNVTASINQAVAAARRAQVAVVFVGDYNSESLDRSSLNLPGDANALIAAVAAANPRTIVVLNSGGAVLMPWLNQVSGVVEAWYPGQVDGTAIARILTGAFNPSGRLPITFPATSTSTPIRTASSYPGVNSVVNFGTGLDVGYRWYQANGVTPLFPFGFGLSYTNFSLSNASAVKTASGYQVSVDVKNTGLRAGAEVVQAYVAYPSTAQEPPQQLRAIGNTFLQPGATQRVTMTIPWSGFQSYQGTSFTTVSGTYTISLGESSASLPLSLSVQF